MMDNKISEMLNYSEVEYSGDNSDDDPEYSKPELNRTNNIETDSTSDNEAHTSDVVVSSHASSENSEVFASPSPLPSRSRGPLRPMSRSRRRLCSQDRVFQTAVWCLHSEHKPFLAGRLLTTV